MHVSCACLCLLCYFLLKGNPSALQLKVNLFNNLVISRLLFPSLPDTFDPVQIWSEDHNSDDEDDVSLDEEERW